jgi:hypothetical protein
MQSLKMAIIVRNGPTSFTLNIQKLVLKVTIAEIQIGIQTQNPGV